MEKREWTLKELEDTFKELDFPEYPRYLGDGLWELSPGCYTGQRGIELFNRLLLNIKL